MNASELLAGLDETFNKILSKKEVLKWCLGYNYKKETKEDVENLIKNNTNGFLPLDRNHEKSIHIKSIEKRYGKAEYMHPISIKFKLYKYVAPDGKWFFIQSVGKGYFVIRTKENSYQIEY